MMHIPPATLRALRALDAAPLKYLSPNDLCKAIAVKHRAFWPIVARMERDRWVDRDGDRIELTWGGLKALREVPVEVLP